MRKSLTYKILAAVLAAGSLGLYAAAPAAAADDYTVNKDGEIISSGNFDNVYGNGHSFTITGDTVIYGYVYGVDNGNYDKDASGGNVTINGNVDIAGAVYGGRSDRSAHHNTVNISGDNSKVTRVYGGFSNYKNNTYNNTVNINGGTVLDEVRGGYSYNGEAYDNTVNISGGSVLGKVYGGWSTYSSAHHNTVNISGVVNVTKDYSGIYGGWSSTGRAYDNTVYISGGSVKGNVYGGYAYGSANDTKIIISGSADIENANLYGSNKTNDTGNTLTIDGWSGSTQSVKNFSDIAFKNIDWKNDKPVLTITAGDADDLKNTTIDTIHIAGGSDINVGESKTRKRAFSWLNR